MWRRSRVAPEGTHHVIAGEPLYGRRFRAVLPFHEPGLAPVEDETGAHHISSDGIPAYEERFLRTFGFYGGLSAVVAPAGWHHIRPDGSLLYGERYAWAGNFQGGRCAVRESSGNYLHLDTDGEPAYTERYRYAGDYREGSAVVQRDDGLSIHIDAEGRTVHETAWLDLDVFHKGFARARDRHGWTHIDRAGRSLYEDRYAMVEPFYNGQARVEGHNGRRLVIDEGGREVIELRRESTSKGQHSRLSSCRRTAHWSLLEDMLGTLAAVPADRPVALLLRHGPRFELEPGDAGVDVALLPEGIPLIRELGARIGPRLASVHASPVRRCVETAQLLAQGAGVALPVQESTRLGLPGAYVSDGDLAGEAFRSWPYETLMRMLASDGPPPAGFHPPGQATRCLLDQLLSPDKPGLHVFVSHDSIVGIFLARTTGRYPSPWIRVLEGGFVWREGTRIRVAYQGCSSTLGCSSGSE